MRTLELVKMSLNDALTILTAAVSLATIMGALYHATKAILQSHANLSAKIDALVGVVSSHQVAIDQASKDIDQIQNSLMKK
jgi:hypothetical protein